MNSHAAIITPGNYAAWGPVPYPTAATTSEIIASYQLAGERVQAGGWFSANWSDPQGGLRDQQQVERIIQAVKPYLTVAADLLVDAALCHN